MGLLPNNYMHCIYSGWIHDPSNTSDNPTLVHITLGLYNDNFIFFSTDNIVEAKFQTILSKLILVDFMGVVEWFLGNSVAPSTLNELFKIRNMSSVIALCMGGA